VAIVCEHAIEELEQAKSAQVSRTVIEWNFRGFEGGNPFLDLMDLMDLMDDKSEKEGRGSKKSR